VRLAKWVAAAAIGILAACATGGAGARTPTTAANATTQAGGLDPSIPGPNQVVIYNFVFYPHTLTVTTGTTVQWINHDIAAHTATRNSGGDQFDSGNLTLNKQFTYTFNTPGTFDYICFYHPGMKARIVVTAAAAAPASH